MPPLSAARAPAHALPSGRGMRVLHHCCAGAAPTTAMITTCSMHVRSCSKGLPSCHRKGDVGRHVTASGVQERSTHAHACAHAGTVSTAERVERRAGRAGAPGTDESLPCCDHTHGHDHGHAHAAAPLHVHAAEDNGHCCHSHLEPDETWGAVRLGIHEVFRAMGIVRAVDALQHSVIATTISSCALVLGLLLQLPAVGSLVGSQSANAIACLSLMTIVAFSGFPLVMQAIYKLMQPAVDAHVLMAIAGAGALAVSLPFEAATLFVLFQIAHSLEARFVAAGSASLSSLLSTVPSAASVVRVDEGTGQVDWESQDEWASEQVAVGSYVVVKPGSAVPLDGVVHTGEALVSQQNITGESIPVLKRPGDGVVSGAVVQDGSLVVKSTALSRDSAPARIAAMTAAALQNKAPLEDFVTRLTTRWSEVVLAASAAVLLILLATGLPLFGAGGAVYRTLGLLTAAAPCALILIPFAYVCASSVLTQHGILVKGSCVLDEARRVDFVGLDKTGTLSEGHLMCERATSVAGPGGAALEQGALEAAAALSLRGQHPVCDAVLDYYVTAARGADGAADRTLPDVAQFSSQPGSGMSGRIDGTEYVFASVATVAALAPPPVAARLQDAAARSAHGKAASALLWHSGGAGGKRTTHVFLFTFVDAPKHDSAIALRQLRRDGLSIGLLTGDNAESAGMLAQDVGISGDEVFAALSPGEKAQRVRDLRDAGRVVMMVGDGINDAPALAEADIAAGFSSTVDSPVASLSGVVLLDASSQRRSGDVTRIAFLLHVARALRRVIWQNVAIALASLLIASVPTVAGVFPLWLAVLLHEGSSVFVAINSCRLLGLRPRQQEVASHTTAGSAELQPLRL